MSSKLCVETAFCLRPCEYSIKSVITATWSNIGQSCQVRNKADSYYIKDSKAGVSIKLDKYEKTKNIANEE